MNKQVLELDEPTAALIVNKITTSAVAYRGSAGSRTATRTHVIQNATCVLNC